MCYTIALNFEDGITRFVDCKPGEKVLDAAFRNKINLPMDCSDGVCGTCKCRAERGSYDLGDDYIEDALTEDEAAEGLVLTCQMTVSSDCVLAVPVPSTASTRAPVPSSFSDPSSRSAPRQPRPKAASERMSAVAVRSVPVSAPRTGLNTVKAERSRRSATRA